MSLTIEIIPWIVLATYSHGLDDVNKILTHYIADRFFQIFNLSLPVKSCRGRIDLAIEVAPWFTLAT
jgi:hypothetical protein